MRTIMLLYIFVTLFTIRCYRGDWILIFVSEFNLLQYIILVEVFGIWMSILVAFLDNHSIIQSVAIYNFG